jgi:nucleoside-diphosphate-sugar epimerase
MVAHMSQHEKNCVIITGVSSFVGWHLARFFNREGWEVIGTLSKELPAYAGLHGERVHGLESAGIALMKLDITDAKCTSAFIREKGPSLWIHHAGWATNYAGRDYDLVTAARINHATLRPIYQALAETGCSGFLLTGSGMEYSNSDTPHSEDEICWPDNPYGFSKLGQTILCRQLSQEFDIRTRVARVFIPFGQGDAPQKLLSSVARALASHQSIELTPCEQIRDFLHVHDLCLGYRKLVSDLSRECLFDIFNLSSGQPVRLRDLLQLLAAVGSWSTELLHFGAVPMRSGEALVQAGDARKSAAIMDWRARDLSEMLRDFIEVRTDLQDKEPHAGGVQL